MENEKENEKVLENEKELENEKGLETENVLNEGEQIDTDEEYEDDFENECQEEIIENSPKENTFDNFDINIKPDPCCCKLYCYCNLKYRLWKIKQELNRHRDTLLNIQLETELLIQNTQTFRENLRKSLE